MLDVVDEEHRPSREERRDAETEGPHDDASAVAAQRDAEREEQRVSAEHGGLL